MMNNIVPQNSATIESLRAAALLLTKGKSQAWRYVTYNGLVIRHLQIDLGGHASGDDIDEATALQALIEANMRLHERRSAIAKKAAVTRARRKEEKFYELIEHYQQTGVFTPSLKCRICGRILSDQESLNRGIGSECWDRVLRHLETNPRRVPCNNPCNCAMHFDAKPCIKHGPAAEACSGVVTGISKIWLTLCDVFQAGSSSDSDDYDSYQEWWNELDSSYEETLKEWESLGIGDRQ